MRAILLLVACALVAGCTTAAPATEAPAVEPAVPTDPAVVRDPEPQVVAVPVELYGRLGMGGYACVAPAAVCHDATVYASDNDVVHESPGATLQAVNLTLTWTAVSAATERLALGTMVMGPNGSMIASVEGVSPLTIQESLLALPLPGDHVFHAFVYNARTFAYVPGAVEGYATTEQDFTLAGDLTLEVPGATTAAPA